MKAIITAAGMGTRMGGLAHSKCILPVDGEPLIRRSVRILREFGVEVAVVTGFMSGEVVDAVKGLKVSFFHNPSYATSNNVVSLHHAKPFFEGGGTEKT